MAERAKRSYSLSLHHSHALGPIIFLEPTFRAGSFRLSYCKILRVGVSGCGSPQMVVVVVVVVSPFSKTLPLGP